MSEDSYFLSCDFDSDQEHNYYTCAFCDDEVYGQAAIKGHVESMHLEDLFKFPCNICGYNAIGPKYLRAHLKGVHDTGDVLSVATVTVEDREIVTLEVVSMSESDGEAPTFVQSRVPARLVPDTSGDLGNSETRFMRATRDFQRALDRATEKARVVERGCEAVHKGLDELGTLLHRFGAVLVDENLDITRALS
jgi:hypothetical protein